MLYREDVIDKIMTTLVRDLIWFINNLLQAFLIVGRENGTGKRKSRDGSRGGGGLTLFLGQTEVRRLRPRKILFEAATTPPPLPLDKRPYPLYWGFESTAAVSPSIFFLCYPTQPPSPSCIIHCLRTTKTQTINNQYADAILGYRNRCAHAMSPVERVLGHFLFN